MLEEGDAVRREPLPLRLRQGVQQCRLAGEPLEQRLTLSVSPTSSTDDFSAPLATPAAAPSASSINGTYSGGVSVLPTLIVTQNEVIPRFVANPTISSVRSGDWNDPATWSAGRVPADNDRVLI